MENNMYLYGASGHCKVIVDILKLNGISVKAIIDDNPRVEMLSGIPVVKSADFLQSDCLIISIGNNNIRKKLSTKISVNHITAIHPRAIISQGTQIGNGTVIMGGVIINPDSVIGEHCIINTGAIIEHDCKIADFVHISPGVSLAGNVSVGEGSHVGIGATIIQGVKIGKWVTIGAGAVILRDVPDYAVIVGNPGKIIKYNPAQ
ncbi:MAG TPA: acetyltransferase [Flavobacterium sp.]|nr:acetyltransferase [Flavobacterium sp.]